MEMNPYDIYKKQQEYEEYIENQVKAAVELVDEVEEGCDQNDTVRLFAEHLFRKDLRYIKSDFCGMLLDDDTDITDIFHIMIELLLYGYNILNPNSQIFDIERSYDDIIYDKLRPYFKSIGIVIEFNEQISSDLRSYQEKDDLYCMIIKNEDNRKTGWDILGYNLFLNEKFTYDHSTTLSNYNAVFKANNNNIFYINFKIDSPS